VQYAQRVAACLPRGHNGRRTPSSSTTSWATSGVLNSCNVWTLVVDYAAQVLTLALVLGIALRIGRWEREWTWRDRGDP
jgi:hypothetical protein